jgi:O-antigen/teichoic acid export membrane protein
VSRTTRFLKGFGLGYVNLVVMTVAGFFLTRFFLRHLGQADYGYWLIASQLLGFATFLDLGVVAILPREIAYITGRCSRPQGEAEINALLERVSTIVLLQLPVVATLLLIGWFLLPASWGPMRTSLGVMFIGFAASFPLRIPTAALTGLQDLAFLGYTQLACWAAGTVLSLVLVQRGWGLTSLAFGYVATQVSWACCGVARLLRHGLRPRRLAWPGAESGRFLRSAGWAIAGQAAQLLVFGTEGVIVGYLFGPELVVPYTTTGKLLSILANQPNLVMAAAAPGLAETRSSRDGDTRLTISTALGQGMLMLTATIVVVITAINESFIRWWLGPEQYGGLLLTVVFGARLFLRQWNTTLVYSLFSFGHERRLAVVGLVDGVLTAALSFVIARQMGPLGVPLGGIAALVFACLPLNLAGIRRDTGVPATEVARRQLWWTWRAVLLAALAALGSSSWNEPTLLPVLGKAMAAMLLCLAVLGPLLLRPPLGPYVRPRLQALRTRVGLS